MGGEGRGEGGGEGRGGGRGGDGRAGQGREGRGRRGEEEAERRGWEGARGRTRTNHYKQQHTQAACISYQASDTATNKSDTNDRRDKTSPNNLLKDSTQLSPTNRAAGDICNCRQLVFIRDKLS